MPSWSARLLSTSPALNNNPGASGSPRPEPPPSRRPQGLIADEPALQSYRIPTLQHVPDTGVRPGISPSGGGARHGRSISHPFPSIFSSGKKEESRGPVDRSITLPLPGDRGLGEAGFGQHGRSPSKGGKRAVPQQADKDLMTGRCMTCDSLVRWPKDLKVFRCTVCLMVNDLKPVALGACLNSGSSNPSLSMPENTPGPPTRKRGISFSLKRTRSIIDGCVVSYLQARLAQMTSPDVMHPLSSPPLHIPGQVPRETDDDEADNVRSRYLNDVPSIPAVANLQIYAGSTPRRSFRRGHSSTEVSQGAVVDLREALELRGSGTSKGYEHGVSAGNEPYIPPTSKAPLLNPDVPIDLGGTGDKSIYVKLDHARAIFRPLEDYIVACFASLDGINTSFFVSRSPLPARSASEGAQVTWGDRSKVEPVTGQQASISELDGKTLLLGDFAENGSWWTGGRPQPNRSPRVDHSHDRSVTVQSSITNLKTPMINWAELDEFYQSVIKAGSSWESKWRQLLKGQNEDKSMSRHISEYKHDQWQDIGADLAEAQLHAQRTLLKATETILKRPGRPLKSPDECRFLLILLANPLLYSSNATEPSNQRSFATKRNGPGQHSGIIKRILGLLANLPNECHYHLVGWFSRFSEGHFRRMVDLVGSFVTYRLTRQHGGKRSDRQDPTEELIPSLAGLGVASSAQLHAALGVTGPSRRADGQAKTVIYGEDWQLRAAAKVMSLLFSANNNRIARRPRFASLTASPDVSVAPHRRAHTYSQMLPISDFYNTLLDYSDIIADFEAWESRRGRFSFCQYPFFYSIWAKIHILEYDARRQMEVKAREAFFNSIMGRKAISQYLVLKIRRDCLVEDSLRGVSENVGSGQEDIKKSLKIEFLGEEGVDAGGLRKEWFLLLVREVFDPHHGMFCYDDDSHYCYFNPNCFETSDQFFLVGVVLGLAIYNSTILDVALPPFAFKKLLACAPTSNAPAISPSRPQLGHTLEDLAEFRPALAHGLRQLLEFEGDVETTFCRDFVAEVESYGQILQVPLCPNGETKAVTNSNRREFVDLYVHYLLDTAVARQYDPFKRGFYTVCGGNALSLFRSEEIELLVRGSDEVLDIASLRAVAIYEHWGSKAPGETEPVVVWFWKSFEAMVPKDQRKLLSFITGSDRIPAMGASNLVIKLICLGDNCERFPIARTCFNMVGLYKYSSMGKLMAKLNRAISESEGFGLR